MPREISPWNDFAVVVTPNPPEESSKGQPVRLRAANGDLSDEFTRRLLRGLVGVMLLCALAVPGVFVVRRVTGIGSAQRALSVVDAGFLTDMIDHHNQAIEIAQSYLHVDPAGGAASYAYEVIIYQRRDIRDMTAWLKGASLTVGTPDRSAMTWMGMSTPISEMPGMQSPARLAELAASSGAQSGRLYFSMMSDHHLGGIHMAEYEAGLGSNRDVKKFAALVAKNQHAEIVEYRLAAARLGL